MSDELPTLDENVFIHSTARDGNFKLTAYRVEVGKGDLASRSYPYEKYCDLWKQMWSEYITRRKRPGLLEHSLSDTGIIYETLHCIATGDFSGPLDSGPLPDYKEKLLLWLLEQKDSLRRRIADTKQVEWFIMNLKGILSTHLSRKRNQDSLMPTFS